MGTEDRDSQLDQLENSRRKSGTTPASCGPASAGVLGWAQTTWFCLPQYIESAAAKVFRAPHGENLLRGLPRDAFTERLTYYLGSAPIRYDGIVTEYLFRMWRYLVIDTISHARHVPSP